LKKSEETLLLLYSLNAPVKATTVTEWVEYASPAAYRRDVLRPLHDKRLIELDERTDEVVISPTGVDKVEKELPLTG
jgi:hypothetical protein